MKNNFVRKPVALILITTMIFLLSSIIPANAVNMEDDFIEPTLENENTESNKTALPLENDDLDLINKVLAQKAIEAVNEMADLQPQFYRYFQYSNIENIRKLYTPTTNIIIAYVFELRDNDDFSYVVMNAATHEFMQMGAGKSPYLSYLEENGKSELGENEKFIYDSIKCWVGTIQDNEITIVDTYTNEIVAVEEITNIAVDQQYQNF